MRCVEVKVVGVLELTWQVAKVIPLDSLGEQLASIWPGRTYSPLLANCVAARWEQVVVVEVSDVRAAQWRWRWKGTRFKRVADGD